jgi:hypothetical protein
MPFEEHTTATAGEEDELVDVHSRRSGVALEHQADRTTTAARANAKRTVWSKPHVDNHTLQSHGLNTVSVR